MGNQNAGNWFDDFEPQPPGERFQVPDVEQVHQQLQNVAESSEIIQQLEDNLASVRAENSRLQTECDELSVKSSESQSENSRLQEQLIDLQSACDRATDAAGLAA